MNPANRSDAPNREMPDTRYVEFASRCAQVVVIETGKKCRRMTRMLVLTRYGYRFACKQHEQKVRNQL